MGKSCMTEGRREGREERRGGRAERRGLRGVRGGQGGRGTRCEASMHGWEEQGRNRQAVRQACVSPPHLDLGWRLSSCAVGVRPHGHHPAY